MRYFWLLDRHVQKEFNFQYQQQGQENLADYQSKARLGSHHTSVPPFYLLTPESPRYLPRADKPSVRRGCVDKLLLPSVDRHGAARYREEIDRKWPGGSAVGGRSNHGRRTTPFFLEGRLEKAERPAGSGKNKPPQMVKPPYLNHSFLD
eukprot:scaffold31709_cov41-Cyclotella_meneghiniana.AAC.17